MVQADWSAKMECPHKHGNARNIDDAGKSANMDSTDTKDIKANSTDATVNITALRERCPIDSRNMMPVDLQGEAIEGLSNGRVGSSIPRADTESGTWLYPSPQMFYNAMQRKGKDPCVEDMDVIVSIHNVVNEQTWQAVLCWERHFAPGEEPRLKRFLGRPEKLSPRAWMRTQLMGYARPFDRHDWYVSRSDGREVRYVIDFYSGSNVGSFHIDARPALDNPRAIYERVHFATTSLFNTLHQRLSGLF
jgi:cytochrome c heme-lyase